ncbi:hypothetical protein L7F22_022285 [Adiantum nelumboides]|nr:hypothetical protein [Adiantum nelumboides]
MESSEAASRRLNRIASQLAAASQKSSISSLASMVCNSGSGMHSISRKDSRLMFARQDSSYLPAYCREAKECQASNAGSVPQGMVRRDSRLLFARQGSHTRAYFMRECLDYQLPCPAEGEGTSCKQQQNMIKAAVLPESVLPKSNHPHGSADNLDVEPRFARVVNEEGEKGLPTDATYREDDWFPRMDVMESMASYVITIELPGVQVDSIRVEVNEDGLLVSGSRSPECRMDCTEQKEKAFYHRRELSQGPFKAQWPMPKHINLDRVSAEFMDGFLKIILPKNAL